MSQKSVADLKGIKVGSAVRFTSGLHGKTTRTGTVIAIVKPDEMPDFEGKKFRDLAKTGVGKVKAREEKSFLVQSEGVLYWPQNKTLALVV